MRISENGIELIKRFEGLKLNSYKCPAGVWTIGYGHTGKDVTAGLKINADTAEKLLDKDIESICYPALSQVKVPLTQNQFDALCSLIFNIGQNNFLSSTMLKLLNAGKYRQASQQFGRWVFSNHVKLSGLVKRREAECLLFNS